MLEENEGKLVMISGKLEGELPLKDPVTGVELPSMIAERYVEIYDGRKNDGETTWDWDLVPKDYSEKGNYGVNSSELISSTLAVPITLGEFSISEKLLLSITSAEEFRDYDFDQLEQNGWYLFDGDVNHDYYLSTVEYLPSGGIVKDWSADKGLLRISYRTLAMDDPVYTMIGIQQGNQLVKADDLDFFPVYEGRITIEELEKKAIGNPMNVLVIGFVIGGLLIFFGIRKLVR